MSEFASGNEELTLPKATVQKIISEVLPSELTFSKEARDVVIECCIEFIMILSDQSNEIAEKDAKKTIASDHVIGALRELGFPEYIEPIEKVLVEHKEAQKGRERKSNKFQNSGFTEEELLRQQEELFRQSRSRLQNQKGDGVKGEE
ncbi:negative cofactor 2 transcription regulator complex subunit NCB2 [Cyberlindnera jadinii NRRL Y-1542]|uniref:Histone-fold-containing protein n=1 Tax=Cyberlindnera jadinii (strain ATCC 18201 / CBS 1600 / BCRC 20928 / JCM 3617 / NBRC 0987 / NRRL Y-1542) TaxID=983966 RepID=A0A1E4S0W9_CYBJN|nr:histone-fold-containing protein [Cyberlindnera jadinii NRRL Y-1542]ODV73129.1 histone-fold-containing protein [Cyberlindnera jadinii NRRL Y-1542]